MELGSVNLRWTNKAKYLGVTITNDLTWNHHINNITNKANASLRFIKRNVKTNSIKTKELLPLFEFV
jgi:hypothetical protein